MKTKPENCEELAGEIEASERKLEELEQEMNEIGEPACCELRHRLEGLKVEERALKRNFAEAKGEKAHNKERMRKVVKLLHHIESEENSIGQEVHFLHQAAPTTLEYAFKGGASVLDLGVRGLKTIIGDHQLLLEFGPLSTRPMRACLFALTFQSQIWTRTSLFAS